MEVEVFASKDGPDVTLDDVIALGRYLQARRDRYAGFVVTTGTDTLEEIAYGLELLLGGWCFVVVTGAMRPPYAEDFDGYRGLHTAVSLCRQAAQGRRGVAVAMGGQVIPARLAHKQSISRLKRLCFHRSRRASGDRLSSP